MLFRRVFAGGVAFVVLLLLVLAIKSCRDSARRDSFKSYVRDQTALVQASGQESRALFGVLTNAAKQSPVALQNAVNGYENDSSQLVDRAKSTGRPDELATAQRYFVDVLKLRRDGIGVIAQSLQAALGTQGQQGAVSRIARQMQAFLASDVLYARRVLPNLTGPLKKEGLLGEVTVPQSRFLPDLQWVRPTVVAAHIQGLRTGQGTAGPTAPGLHGTALVGTVMRPGGQSLSTGGATQVTVTAKLSFDVTVMNGGSNDERDVTVAVSLTGAGRPIVREQSIPMIAAGQQKIVSIPLAATPPIGRPASIHVEVKPVPGEKKLDNNRATYPVIFTR